MWSNFHTHSIFCDGKATLRENLTHARSLGLYSLGFSSHAPLPFDCSWCMKKERLPEYIGELNELKQEKNSTEVFSGLEADYIPGVISPADFSPLLDYTIGSIHFVDALPDGRHWEIDGTHESFLPGLASIFNNDIKHAVTRYLELTREMVINTTPDIVGHLDKIKIQNKDDKFFRESDTWYQNEIIKTLEVIAARGCIVEVNTRGIYQKKSPATYPSPWILEQIYTRGIPVTISSDAHHPSDLINQFPETATCLKKIGFKKISVLHHGGWNSYPFDTHGIVIAR